MRSPERPRFGKLSGKLQRLVSSISQVLLLFASPEVHWSRSPFHRWHLGLLCILFCAHAVAVEGEVSSAATARATASASIDADLFRRDGFLWIRGFASTAEVDGLRAAMAEMIDTWEASTEDRTSKDKSLPHASLSFLRTMDARSKEPDHLFLIESATKASFFLESGDVNGSAHQPSMPRRRTLRKVGHGLHLANSPIRDFAKSPKIVSLVRELGWQHPVIVQTLYRLAPPLAAGVDRHQDSTTLYTEPPSCLGIWLSLEDASSENGCLRVRVGSHNETIRERLVREKGHAGKGARLVFKRYANASVAPDDAFEPLHTASGDLIVTHGALEHFSAAGKHPSRSRESLQMHIVEASAKWSSLNWLQYPPGQQFDRLEPRPALQEEL